ncbi:hypothetical protein E2E30_19170 (plasmid) [Sphingomonas sp. AAP5]|uniref:hypothetical protein n=2 Tax=Sphingomonas TaxID=13687 RepID=UPI001056FCA5|nr:MULTISPECIES: hypothetical protein [unclassified Sphingomonas]MBB3588894.1 hypothetical protein [Sphingomonas sp. BK481]QBM77998.1 hypothetical protein E2E30_19170 [Sphingomonas sp. AAP5]
MSITFFLSAGAKNDVMPATITARQLAAFRSFARTRDELVEQEDDDPLEAGSFEARVCPWSLASICALFDHDEGVIAVVEEAQFRGLNVRFYRDDQTRSISMRVADTPDGSRTVNLVDQTAHHVLDAMRLTDDHRGSIPIAELRQILAEPTVRENLHQLDTGMSLDRLDQLADQADTDHDFRLVWG